jgi:hypothetical protein
LLAALLGNHTTACLPAFRLPWALHVFCLLTLAAPPINHSLYRPARPPASLPACLPSRFDFGEAGRLLYEFVWNDFADWYIEAAKARLYGGDAQAAQQVGIGCRGKKAGPFMDRMFWFRGLSSTLRSLRWAVLQQATALAALAAL